MADRIGQQFGSYRLLHLIGQGSLAEVYLSEHIHLGTKAVVKVLRAPLASGDVERFRTEAHALATLIHPNIIRILDFGDQDGIPFLITDYAPNGTLRQRHPKGIPLSPLTIVPYVKQVASALQYVHDHKLIHRNVKPENMLVGQNNEILLDDFCFVSVAHSSTSLSVQDSVGTIGYMAPEQLQGKPHPASDQYALGIVVYEWLTSYRPFRGSITEIMNQHFHTPPPPLREKFPDLAPEIEEVVLIALNKDPHSRFASIQAFATAFEQACQPAASLSSISTIDLPQPPAKASSTPSSPLPTPSNPEPAPSPGQPRRFSRRTVLIGLGGLTVVGGGLTWFALQKLSTPPIHIPANLNIYVTTSSDSTSPRSSMYALRASDGTERWHYIAEQDDITPLKEANGIVYIYIEVYLPGTTSGPATTQSRLLALRASDGTLLWQVQTKSKNNPSVVVDNSVVYIGTEDQSGQNIVSALRAENGKPLWLYKVPGKTSTVLTGVQEFSGMVYAITQDPTSADQSSGSSTLYTLRASDGAFLWQYRPEDNNISGVGIGANNGRVYFFKYDVFGGKIAENLDVLQASDGKLLWQLKGFPTSLLYGSEKRSDILYLGTSNFNATPQKSTIYALRAGDGSVLWQYKTDGDAYPRAISNGMLYVVTQYHRQVNSTTSLVALRVSDGTRLWQRQLDGYLSGFAVTDEAIYVVTGTDTYPLTGAMYALQASDGGTLWNYQKKQGTISRLKVKDGVIYFSTKEDGNKGGSMSAYQASNGTPIWQTNIEVSDFQVG